MRRRSSLHRTSLFAHFVCVAAITLVRLCVRRACVRAVMQPASPSLKFITAIKTKEDWEEQVMKAPTTTLCVCDIYAEWCGPCVSLNKRVANLSGDFIECVPHRTVYRIDNPLRLERC